MILYIDLLNTMLGFSLSISFVYKCMNCMTLFYQLTKSIHYPSSQNLLCELQNVCVQSQWMCMLWTGEERLPAGDGGSGGAGHRPEARLSGDQVRPPPVWLGVSARRSEACVLIHLCFCLFQEILQRDERKRSG